MEWIGVKNNKKSSGKLNLFDQYQLLFDGEESDLDKIQNSSLFVLMRWLSFCKTNVNICEMINRNFKYVNHDILKYLLYYKIDIDNRYIKFYKNVKDEKFSFVKDYLMKYFGYSECEYNTVKPIIDSLLESDDFKRKLNKVFGFSQKECKLLDIKFVSLKKEKKDTGSSSLFNFVKK